VKPPAPPPRSICDLKQLTPARVGLGRSGASLPTSALLGFTLDHARARDAVHAAFDAAALVAGVTELGLAAIDVRSRAGNRRLYLARPDLGRRLDPASTQHLEDLGRASRGRVVIVIADGLSPTAVHAHALSLLRQLLPQLAAAKIEIGPIVVATAARVALGDEIGEILGASLALMLIGERPGLSAPDSLGAYLTFAPKLGRTDADRNCVSNIHRAGLSCEEAAFKIAWLIREGISRKITGVALKDGSGDGTPRQLADKSSSA
jgi:ethanolamine ammonia-lyase small subunit